MAAPPDGLVGSLWNLNIKINSSDQGFQDKFHIVNSDPAAAKVSAIAVATAYRRILPADGCEIFYATISNYNTKRDSRYLRSATGPGLFLTSTGPDVGAKYDVAQTMMKVRMENSDGGAVPIKVGPVPDAIFTGGAVVPTINDVVATFAGADPVAGDLTDYGLQMENFLKILTKHTVYLKSTAIPGGAFTYWPWVAAFPMGPGKKKGSRSFV
jgi:hypothetical protein